jgi:hypothetical protein
LIGFIAFYISSFALILAVVIFDKFKPGMGIPLSKNVNIDIFQYLPVVFSTITSITGRAVTVALTRMTEFLSMASVSTDELNDYVEEKPGSLISKIIEERSRGNKWGSQRMATIEKYNRGNKPGSQRRTTTHHIHEDGTYMPERDLFARRVPRSYYAYRAVANPYGAGPKSILTMLGHGDLLLALVSLMNLVAELFLVPLKSAWIIVSKSSNGGIVKVSTGFGITLLVIYGILIILAVCLASIMHGAKTGLKWDPSSISDLLALTHGTNTMAIFQGYDMATQKDMLYHASCEIYANVTRRIGYWRKPDGNIWYGIAYVPVKEVAQSTLGPRQWHRGEVRERPHWHERLWNTLSKFFLSQKVEENSEIEMQSRGPDIERNSNHRFYGPEGTSNHIDKY